MTLQDQHYSSILYLCIFSKRSTCPQFIECPIYAKNTQLVLKKKKKKDLLGDI